MARWLITGGAGFIGSNLVEALVRKGHRVRVLDNLSTGKAKNLKPFVHKIEFIKGDIRSIVAARKAVRHVDVVSHLAALRAVQRSIDDPRSTNDVNVNGTLNLLIESKKAGVKKFIYASSSSVYGNSTKFPQSPLQKPQPISPYAVSKLTGEHYCHVFAHTFGLSTVVFRYFNVFGPRMDPMSKYALVIPLFMKWAYEGRPIEIHGNGRQSRDFCHIENVIETHLLAAKTKNLAGDVVNIACGETHSLMSYVRILERLSGHKIHLTHKPNRAGDVAKTWADISVTKRILGYRPLVRFEDGIEKTWKDFLKRKEKQ